MSDNSFVAQVTPVTSTQLNDLAKLVNADLSLQVKLLQGENDELRAERDAAVKALPPDDAERFICLAHPHNNRWEEALCSAKYQLDAAVREREELIAFINKRDELMIRCPECDYRKSHAHCVHTIRTRLAACERVVEAAEQCSGKRLDMGLMKALANLDEALIQYRSAVAAEMQGERDA